MNIPPIVYMMCFRGETLCPHIIYLERKRERVKELKGERENYTVIFLSGRAD